MKISANACKAYFHRENQFFCARLCLTFSHAGKMTTPTHAAFEAACNQVSSGELGQLADEDQLSLYGLYSVALKGPAKGSEPSFLNIRGYAKFQAWAAVSHLSRDDAMVQYMDLVTELKNRGKTEKPQRSNGLGRQAPTGFDIGAESASNAHDLCHWASVGDIKSLKYLLNSKGVPAEYRDEEGMTALMRAADRNNVRVIDILVAAGANVNAQDREGLSALHYAAYCDHAEACGVLVLHGANCEIVDNDASTPLDAASDTTRKVMMLAKKGEWERPAPNAEDMDSKFSLDRTTLIALFSLTALAIAIGLAAWKGRTAR